MSADLSSVWNAVFGAQGLNGYPLEVRTIICDMPLLCNTLTSPTAMEQSHRRNLPRGCRVLEALRSLPLHHRQLVRQAEFG
jgi:hypothetical protein